MENRFSTVTPQTANHNLLLSLVVSDEIRLSLPLVGGYPRPSYKLDLYCGKQSGRMFM